MQIHRAGVGAFALRGFAATALVLGGGTLAWLGAGVGPDALAAEGELAEPLRLDESIVIRFRAAVRKGRVGPDTIRIRTTPDGDVAQGAYVVGRLMFDASAQRRVVVRPEAVREYYELIRGKDREDAARRAERLLRRVERRGRPKLLDDIDRDLRNLLGASFGAGTRLDDEDVFATYPPPLSSDHPLAPYRRLLVGDDTLWTAHLDGDPGAYPSLVAELASERFAVAQDAPFVGLQPPSVLRARTYRRVLVDRRSRNRVTFVPQLPQRADLLDAGYRPLEQHIVRVTRALPTPAVLIPEVSGPRVRFQGRKAGFSTFSEFDPTPFADEDARVGLAGSIRPRVINVTPPNGETLVDPTTDWEQPDDLLNTPEAQRRPFRARIRFAHALDPRTIDTTTVRLTLTAAGVGTPQELPMSQDLPVEVALRQSRLGLVEVELTPVSPLDFNARYAVRVDGRVRSLGGELLGRDFLAEFTTGQILLSDGGASLAR